MNAKEKNAHALKALFGSEALVDKLLSTRVAVVSPNGEPTTSARLLAIALADTLARLWPNIDFFGGAAELQREIAVAAAASGGVESDAIQVAWQPPYAVVITIACDALTNESNTIRVGANGWDVEIGPDAGCGSENNPIAPAFAAALAAAQVFLRVFSVELQNTDPRYIETLKFDVREICAGGGMLNMEAIDLGNTTVFGVGAVTHAFMWLLEQWPAPVTGSLNLVDQDEYGTSNGQRYAFMPADAVKRSKAELVAQRLRTKHPALIVRAHDSDLNTYCAKRGYEEPLQRIVTGLDSAENRRHAALKLPVSAINMWTAGIRIGGGRYTMGETSACLACEYVEDPTEVEDEVARLYRLTSIRPDKVRELLDTSRGLTEQEAENLANQWQIPKLPLIGQPLRSVLPILCSTGRIQLPTTSEAVDVPFAFASFFAGISGFIMFLRDLQNHAGSSEAWNQNVFKVPSGQMHSARQRHIACACCAEFFANATKSLPT